MKKIFLLCAIFTLLMSAVCSAAQVRAFDGGLNDFVQSYNQGAQTIYDNMGVDAKLYQHPVKNVTSYYGGYTAYTTKIGSEQKWAPYLTLFVDKSGYVSHMVMEGYIKNVNRTIGFQKIFSSSMTICMLLCGLNQEEIDSWVWNSANSTTEGDGANSRVWSSFKNKWIHIDSKKIGVIEKNKRFLFHIYATND